MENMLLHSTCQNFGTNCEDLIEMITEPKAWPNFSTKLKEIEALQQRFHSFSYIPRGQNIIADSLAKTGRAFHMILYFFVVLLWFDYPYHLKFG
ncbi:hypothetical protein Bca4012_020799 [Brassica carinata]